MLIHPWDEATAAEWRALLSQVDFGQLVTAGLVDGYPVVVPTHFLYDGADRVLLHLARPNPVWQALAADPHVVLSISTDYVYVEADWNADDGAEPGLGVPTSYYTAVQLFCTAEVVDDPAAKAGILAAQLAHFEPSDSTRVTPSVEVESDRRQLKGIRGIRLQVEGVRAKMKYGGNKSPAQRARIAERLRERSGPMDAAARQHLTRGLPPDAG